MSSSPSWDLLLIVFFVISVGYGFVLQRDKVIVTLLSIYAGIVVANVLAEPLKLFFVGDKTVFNQVFISAKLSPFTIQTCLFALTVILVSVRSGIGGRSASRGALSPFELAVFSFLNSALLLTAIFSFMTPEMRENFIHNSRIANVFIQKQTWWVIAPLMTLIATGGLGKSRSNDYY